MAIYMQGLTKGYHQKIIPFVQKRQLNVGIVGPAGSGKTSIMFWLLKNMVDANNPEAHIVFFSTTMTSSVNETQFEEF